MKAWEYFLARLATQEIARAEREYEREAEISLKIAKRICQELLKAVEHDPNRSRDEMLFNAGALRAAGIIAENLRFPETTKIKELSDKLLKEAIESDSAKNQQDQ
ncbi:hypothetical protein A7K93_10650 [Candidatus Methylacidiphilum fumarolicum]|uniref:Uncharacterized protein n=2 Tax=Candidatus Methylacidiphilum fumarolicum TaxID=591154 RepID=I0JYG9_METFB|nr:hypothetical protein [Candidatus Methylacidiphilum fumarolicum]MBW6414823.1 hypothetical protein [Candidatus Methylacidiphilum fumarolicum]TFE66509.1 hypothetical protein A7K73_10400 [Candidatus Methylacidiphilum fumarolicum]TFE71571.1 hypothetical protein A7K72_10670 [Candidatus Methylacidiphilum fumarolicum]TFE71578.1 hypothetical protein A7K93_10650 [Candidatus Methylacidiphilum fumarolicum]TFE76677.1 hypothetical protein A7D33_08815 [Candidatus Methylacidiphilum fumarolicum]